MEIQNLFSGLVEKRSLIDYIPIKSAWERESYIDSMAKIRSLEIERFKEWFVRRK